MQHKCSASKFIHLHAHLLQAFSHINCPSTPQDFTAKSIMIVKAVILVRLQKHLTQRLELGDLLGEESLPGDVKFVWMATVPGEVCEAATCMQSPQS